MRTRRILIADAPPCPGRQCPSFDRAHAAVLEFADRGDALVIVGAPDDRATEALVRLSRRRARDVSVVGSVDDVESVEVVDPEAVSYVIAPGTSVDHAGPVLARLRERCPRLRGQHPDECCYHATDRDETIRSVGAACDVALLDARQGSGNRDLLRTEALLAGLGRTSHRVADPTRLRPSHLDAATIALIPAQGVPEGAVEQIAAVLTGVGPHSVVRRVVRTRPWDDVGQAPARRTVRGGFAAPGAGDAAAAARELRAGQAATCS